MFNWLKKFCIYLLKNPGFYWLKKIVANFPRCKGRRIISQYLYPLHRTAIHNIRNFFANNHFLSKSSFEKLEDPSNLDNHFNHLASKLRDAIAACIKHEPERLHCTIKLTDGWEEQKSPEKYKIWTIGRSTPIGDRPYDVGPEKFRVVGNDTSFAAPMGCYDGRYKWEHYYPCFSCNDLVRYVQFYRDSRENHLNYYKACIDFPIHVEQVVKGQCATHTIGFVTFDSRSIGAFTNMPCIFDYRDNLDGYKDALDKCPVFHLGGIIVDTLAAILASRYPEEG